MELYAALTRTICSFCRLQQDWVVKSGNLRVLRQQMPYWNHKPFPFYLQHEFELLGGSWWSVLRARCSFACKSDFSRLKIKLSAIRNDPLKFTMTKLKECNVPRKQIRNVYRTFLGTNIIFKMFVTKFETTGIGLSSKIDKKDYFA